MVGGMSVGTGIDLWKLNGGEVSSSQLFFWMDDYCRKNALGSTLSGAIDYANEVSAGNFSKILKNK